MPRAFHRQSRSACQEYTQAGVKSQEVCARMGQMGQNGRTAAPPCSRLKRAPGGCAAKPLCGSPPRWARPVRVPPPSLREGPLGLAGLGQSRLRLARPSLAAQRFASTEAQPREAKPRVPRPCRGKRLRAKPGGTRGSRAQVGGEPQSGLVAQPPGASLGAVFGTRRLWRDL